MDERSFVVAGDKSVNKTINVQMSGVQPHALAKPDCLHFFIDCCIINYVVNTTRINQVVRVG